MRIAALFLTVFDALNYCFNSKDTGLFDINLLRILDSLRQAPCQSQGIAATIMLKREIPLFLLDSSSWLSLACNLDNLLFGE